MSETANSRVTSLGFARDGSRDGPPFRWDDEHRFLLRCQLDAADFHLHMAATPDGEWKVVTVSEGAVRDEIAEEMADLMRQCPAAHDAAAHIMDTFPVVRRKDEENYKGEHRTKRVILEIYDEMSVAIMTGRPYQARLDSPAGDPRRCHPPKGNRAT